MIFAGYVTYLVHGVRVETLINRLRSELPLKDIKKYSDGGVSFSTPYKFKSTVCEAVKAMGEHTTCKIEKESGIPFLFDRYKKRYGLFAGLLLGMALIFVSSFFIWEIRVEGNTYVPTKDISLTLRSLGIYEGALKRTKDLDKIYNRFLLADGRISWLSVNYDGTVAHIEVKETKVVPEKRDRNKNINIVAECDGIVKRVDALDGASEVLPGETVTKGQLLISSFIESRKTGTVMRAARGFVWASTLRGYTVCIPKRVQEKKATDHIQTKRSLRILGNEMPLYIGDFLYFDHYEKQVTDKPYVIFGSIHLPFSLVTETRKSYDITSKNISFEQAELLAQKELDIRKSSELANAEILSIRKNIKETNDFYIFEYELNCLENIGIETEFEFQE